MPFEETNFLFVVTVLFAFTCLILCLAYSFSRVLPFTLPPLAILFLFLFPGQWWIPAALGAVWLVNLCTAFPISLYEQDSGKKSVTGTIPYLSHGLVVFSILSAAGLFAWAFFSGLLQFSGFKPKYIWGFVVYPIMGPILIFTALQSLFARVLVPVLPTQKKEVVGRLLWHESKIVGTGRHRSRVSLLQFENDPTIYRVSHFLYKRITRQTDAVYAYTKHTGINQYSFVRGTPKVLHDGF